jgi:ABC-type branched-subunit amino acid transport system substrate-binding protein
MVLVTGCGSTDSDTSTAAPTETSTTEEAQSGRAINVGLLAAETGPLAGAGGAFLSGALIGQQLVNETGLIGNGNTINLVIQEASEDPARSATVAAQIAADEQNVGLVCCILSPVAGAVSAVANRDGLPVILYGATQPGLAQPPYIFRTTTMPQFANETLGRELSEETGLKSVAYIVMTDNEGIVSQSESFKAGFASAGVEDLGTVEIVAKQTNFASAATSAIALGAEAISISATQAEAVGMVAALYDKNYDGQIIDKVPFPVYFLPSEVNEAGQRFVDAYNAEYGTLPDSFAAQGFNAIWVMGAALAGAGVEPTRASLGESLNALTEVPGTIYGTVKFENGQMLAVESVKIVSYSKPDGVIVPWIAP